MSSNLAITANVGITFFTLDDAVSDFVKSAYVAPIQAGVRYYLNEQRSGLFLEANAGVHIFGVSTEDVDLGPLGSIEGSSESETYLSFAPQVGFFVTENLSLALRYNIMLIPDDREIGRDSETAGYLGLKVAFNF